MPERSRTAATPRAAGAVAAAKRAPLSKQAWKDVRRALRTQPRAEVHAVEVHGVKIIFKHKFAGKADASSSAGGAKDQPQQSKSSKPDSRKDRAEPDAASGGNPSAPRRNARQKRSWKRLQEFIAARAANAQDLAAHPATPMALGGALAI